MTKLCLASTLLLLVGLGSEAEIAGVQPGDKLGARQQVKFVTAGKLASRSVKAGQGH